jgi:hypothetical protein
MVAFGTIDLTHETIERLFFERIKELTIRSQRRCLE